MAKTTRAELSSAELDAAIALVTRQLAALQRLKRAQDSHREQQEIQRTLMARRRGQLADAQTEADTCGALEWITRARASDPASDATRSPGAGLDPAAPGAAVTSDGDSVGGEVPAQ